MKCAVKDVKNGEQLAADVKNINGQLMLAKGTVLGASHLRLLKTWGVETINVVRAEPGAPARQEPLPAEAVEAATRLVNRRFRFISERTNTVDFVYALAVKRASNTITAQDSVSRAETP